MNSVSMHNHICISLTQLRCFDNNYFLRRLRFVFIVVGVCGRESKRESVSERKRHLSETLMKLRVLHSKLVAPFCEKA